MTRDEHYSSYMNRRMAKAAHLRYGLVDDFGEGGLGIVGNGFAKCGWIRTSSKEPALAVHEGDEITLLAEGFIDMGLPALVGWEGREGFRLELANEVEFYFRLFCECIWLSSVIGICLPSVLILVLTPVVLCLSLKQA